MYFENIKIYPEWNVNYVFLTSEDNKLAIKIYPEWNVNISCFQMIQRQMQIKIYPEWNVNTSLDNSQSIYELY